MQYIKPDVATICRNGSFYGSGIVVQECRKTFCTTPRVMIPPSGGAQGVATDMEINLREMLKKKIVYIIISHLWTNFDKVHKDSERDYWMKADELKNTE
jgi:ATP-dependent Clp protease protease subunit